MELNKNHATGIKVIRKKANLRISNKSVDLIRIGDFTRIGSALPKSNIERIGLSQTIKPPSQIAANPILKAAKKIDLQTASIPWHDLSKTIQDSKTNFSRIKEIYMPTHHHSSSTNLASTQNPQSLHSSNQKPKHIKTESRESRFNQTKSANNLALYSNTSTAIGFHQHQQAESEDPDQINLVSLENLDWSKKLRLDLLFGQRKCSRVPSFHLVKLKRHSLTTFYESTKSSNSSLDTSFNKAPYSTFLKGKKLTRVQINSEFELTPNHFLNK